LKLSVFLTNSEKDIKNTMKKPSTGKRDLREGP